MDYEKKYKEALELARDYYKANSKLNKANENVILEDIFPELKESEDERMIKSLKRLIKAYYDVNFPTPEGFEREDALDWLEKQGEKKSIWHNEDEEPQRGSLILLIMQSGTPIVAKIIEPNHTFNHGERWAYIDDLLEKQGTSYTKKDVDDAYLKGVCDAKHELEKQGEQSFNYENANIQQKDFAPKEVIPRYNVGDVLCDKSCTALNKESQPNFEITDIRNGMYICDKCSFPISQQDEYELVAKRIEQNPVEWNEDNNSIISDLLDYFDEDKCLKHEVNDIVKWLKTIKPQQKGCGENEIKMLDNLITYLDGRKDLLEEIKSTYIGWLKSLKQRIGG